MLTPRPSAARYLVSLCLLLLAGCGGGGGGSGSGGGGGGSSGGGSVTEIALSATTVAFRALSADGNPDQKTLTVTWTDPKVAGVVVGTTPAQPALPLWLTVSAAGNASPVTLTVQRLATRSALAPGNYTFPLRVVTGDANQKVLGTVNALGIGRIAMDPRGNALFVVTEKKFIVIDEH